MLLNQKNLLEFVFCVFIFPFIFWRPSLPISTFRGHASGFCVYFYKCVIHRHAHYSNVRLARIIVIAFKN